MRHHRRPIDPAKMPRGTHAIPFSSYAQACRVIDDICGDAWDMAGSLHPDEIDARRSAVRAYAARLKRLARVLL